MRRVGYLKIVAVCGLVLVFCAQAQAQVVQSKPTPSAQTNGRVNVVVISGSTAYIGGTFTSVRPAGDPLGTGEQPRNHAAAIDLTTGAILPWNPAPSGAITSIAVNSATGNIYLGGSFGKIGPNQTSRKDIAEVDPILGNPITTFKVSGLNKEVQAIYYDAANNGLYIGGPFTLPRPYAAEVDPTTGALNTTWAPIVANVPAQTAPALEVSAITATQDGTNEIVLGGSFDSLNGTTADHYAIGAVDPTTGAELPWLWQGPSFGRGAKYQFNVVGLTADATGVYAAGTGNGGTAIKFDSAGNEIFYVGVDGNAVSVAVLDGELYVAGHFNYYCGNTIGYNTCGGIGSTAPVRHHLIAVNSTTGDLETWHPTANSSLGTFTVAAGSAGGVNYLATGGEFTKLGDIAQQGFGEFSE